MKTKIQFILGIVIAALCLFSCMNEAVDASRSIHITIVPKTILTPFTAIHSGDFDMYSYSDGTAKLRINCFFYNASGELTGEQAFLLDDFDEEQDFDKVIDEQTKTLVVFASCITGTLQSPVMEPYVISGKEHLSTISIEQKDELYSKSFAGYSIVEIPYAETLTVNLEPAFSLVYLYWFDIHAHDNDIIEDSSIIGEYTATATNHWGSKTYDWTMVVEDNEESETDVIIKDFDPSLYDAGYTSKDNFNIYKGTISGSTLTIPFRQVTNVKDSDGNDIVLVGGSLDGTTVYFEDVILQYANGVLTTQNLFGVLVPGGDGWYSLFDAGVKFKKAGKSGGIDDYYLIYHNNNLLSFEGGSFVPSTNLPLSSNNGDVISPLDYPDYNTIYSIASLFPGTFNIFGRTFKGSEQKDYSSQNITIQAGRQYYISFDCNKLVVNFGEGIPSTKSDGVAVARTREKDPNVTNGIKQLKLTPFE